MGNTSNRPSAYKIGFVIWHRLDDDSESTVVAICESIDECMKYIVCSEKDKEDLRKRLPDMKENPQKNQYNLPEIRGHVCEEMLQKSPFVLERAYIKRFTSEGIVSVFF